MLDGSAHPRPSVEVDGERPEMLNDHIVSLTLTERECCPVQVEMLLENSAFHDQVGMAFAYEFRDTEILPLGKAFRVLFPSMDPSDDDRTPREVFRGRVSALEFRVDEVAQPQLCVLGEDGLMAWRMRRTTRTFDAAPLREMVTTLALGDALARPVIDDLTVQVMGRHQVNESDLAFLQRLLADHDATAQVVSGQLQVAPRGALKRGEVVLDLGVSLTAIRVVADLAHQRGSVTLSAYDHGNGDALYAALQPNAMGPGQGRTGRDYLTEFGSTRDHYAAAPVTSDAEARAMVNAIGHSRARQFLRATGTAQGNPQLRVGTHVTLQGLGDRFSNTYFVTAARHCYDRATGYSTEFEAECAYFNGGIAA